MTEERDPYVILGIKPDATDRMVREAYYSRARKAHPDLVGTDGLDAMRMLNEAWALLKDPVRRAAHDAVHGYTRPEPKKEAPRKSSQPAWTGAAGTPPGRPWGHVLDFGIYAGWSLGEIARRDRGYLIWLRDRAEGKPFRGEIELLLEPRPGEAGGSGDSQDRRDKRGRQGG